MTAKPKRSEKIESEIIAHAQKRFAHYGLAKTTMNDIAADIGMSKASLYYYFKDKEALFTVVIEKEQAHFVEQFQSVMTAECDARQLLNQYVQMRLQLFQKLLNLGKLRSSDEATKPLIRKLSCDFRSKEARLINEILKKGIAQKEFKALDADKISLMLVDLLFALRLAGVNNVNFGQLNKKGQSELKERTMTFLEIFLNGIS